MAKWFQNLKGLMDGKARAFVIIIVAVIVLGILFVAFQHFSKGGEGRGSASIGGVPSNIQSTPITGGQQNQEYLATLLAANQRAAQQALRDNRTEVPSIIAAPYQARGSELSAGPQVQQEPCRCCCRVCEAKASSTDAGGEIAKLEAAGKLSPLVAGQLKQLQADGLTPSEYAAQLQRLVKEGKLTPAEAAALEKAYNKAHGVSGAAADQTPASVVKGLLSSGNITPATAAALQKLNGENLSPAAYAKHLQELVREGKLSPAAAKRLMAAYDKAHGVTTTGKAVNGLLASGAITPATAATLKQLNAAGLSPADYAKRLQALVREGKLSPAAAKELMAAYDKAHGGSPANSAVNGLLASGSISPATASELQKLNAQGLSPSQYASHLAQLVKEGKLTAAQAKALEAAYNKTHQGAETGGASPDSLTNQLEQSGAITPAAAAALKRLNAEGLTPEQYRERLAQLVKEGKLSPAAASRLLAAYTAAHSKGASTNSLISKLARSGSISPETAAALQALNSEGLTPSAYQQKLNELVKEGKLTPEQAKELMKAYTREHQLAASGGLGRLIAAQEAQQAAEQTSQQAADQQALNEQEAQLAGQAQDQQKQALQAAENAVSAQARQILTAWNPVRQAVSGSFTMPKSSSGGDNSLGLPGSSAGHSDSGSSQPATSKLIARAGDIMFATLDTAVDSDQPGPVMATIVTGKYKGAKLLGSLQVTPDSEAVILRFITMNYPGWPKSVPISAVAINPQTARTALASSVNHHYLERFGAVFAASFMKGLGNAIQNSGSTTTNNAGTSTQTFADLNTTEKALVGLGEVGSTLGKEFSTYMNIKPTVKVKSGIGMGILFTADVKLPNFAADDSSASSSAKNTSNATQQRSESGNGSGTA